MERLQGPINQYQRQLFGEEHLDHVEYYCSGQETTHKMLGFNSTYEFLRGGAGPPLQPQPLRRGSNTRSRSLEIDGEMPFLDMLQSGESSAPSCDQLSFQALLSLQQQCKSEWPGQSHNDNYEYAHEVLHPDSCLTLDERSPSPVTTETHSHLQQNPELTCCAAAADDDGSGEGNKSPLAVLEPGESGLEVTPAAAPVLNKGKRKRNKIRKSPTKNKEELEYLRMTHIAVERNRRRQMNEHLNALRSLMPCSYIQRGDQASIVGGAIVFVKELEQLLQSLQAQKSKRMKTSEVLDQATGEATSSSSTCSTATVSLNSMYAASSPTPAPYYANIELPEGEDQINCTEVFFQTRNGGELTAERKSAVADVKVTVIQNHVNLKVECPGSSGQLLKVVGTMEDLGLTVLHLNVTSLENTVHYSLNLKVEDDCELGSADAMAMAFHQIFSFIIGDATY